MSKGRQQRFSLALLEGLYGDPQRVQSLNLRASEWFRLEVAQRTSQGTTVGAIVFIGENSVYGRPAAGLALPHGHFTTLHQWVIGDEEFDFHAGQYPPGFSGLSSGVVLITGFFFDPSIQPPGTSPVMDVRQRALLEQIPRELELWLTRKGKRSPYDRFIRADHPTAVLSASITIR